MIVVCIIGLGKILIAETNDHLTETHIRMFPETVRTVFSQHQETKDWFMQPSGTPMPESVSSLSEGLLKIPGVFRVKFWNKDGTILWSDLSDLIGKNFGQDHHFQTASSGKTSYVNKGHKKYENKTEQSEEIVIEVYVPVYDGTSVIGVVELYESDKELSSLMEHSANDIWMLLSSVGAALYLLMLVTYLLSNDVVAQYSQLRSRGQALCPQEATEQ